VCRVKVWLHCALARGVLREFTSVNGRPEVNINLQIAIPLGVLLLKGFKSKCVVLCMCGFCNVWVF
jgi:hypothetical protein